MTVKCLVYLDQSHWCFKQTQSIFLHIFVRFVQYTVCVAITTSLPFCDRAHLACVQWIVCFQMSVKQKSVAPPRREVSPLAGMCHHQRGTNIPSLKTKKDASLRVWLAVELHITRKIKSRWTMLSDESCLMYHKLSWLHYRSVFQSVFQKSFFVAYEFLSPCS